MGRGARCRFLISAVKKAHGHGSRPIAYRDAARNHQIVRLFLIIAAALAPSLIPVNTSRDIAAEVEKPYAMTKQNLFGVPRR